jgi:aryl-alcohol dehydrogenase-like predicted oxidoreductase
MKYRQLGHSGLKVSTLCLGTMTFGEADENSFMHKVGCDEETASQIMAAALDAGVNFFDTADVYGKDGLTEKVIGGGSSGNKRDDVVLATKFRFRMGKGPNGSGASRLRIVRTVEDSLRRLQTDRIDLYQIHMQDIDTPEEETLRALDDLVRQGKVLYLGCSNYAAYRLMESLWTSDAAASSASWRSRRSTAWWSATSSASTCRLCRKHGLGILPWSPLAGGFLSGKFQKDQPPPPGSRLDKWKERSPRFDKPRNWQILAGAQGGRPRRSAPARRRSRSRGPCTSRGSPR